MIEALLQPLGIVWLCLWVGLALGWRQRQREQSQWRLWWWPVVPLILLQICGATPLSVWLLSRIERPYLVEWEALPPPDAVIMLGGTHAMRPETMMGFDLADAGDRVVTAVECVRQHPGSVLVLAGGATWDKEGQVMPISQKLESWIRGWDVVPSEIVHVWPCVNTRDEAVLSGELIRERGWKTVWLVTSASHMRRAEAVFNQAGVEVIPVACEFHGVSTLDAGEGWHLVPQGRMLLFYQVWLHEWAGWWMYRWRGWI